jgi:hypothetical protein
MGNQVAFLPLPADRGVPMIIFAFPAMLNLLIPTIAIEGFLCKRWLGWTTWQAMKLNAASHLVSTVIGIPITWAVMLGLEYGSMGLAIKSHAIQNWHSPLANVIFLS